MSVVALVAFATGHVLGGRRSRRKSGVDLACDHPRREERMAVTSVWLNR